MLYEKRQTVRKATDQLLYLELGADNGGIVLNLSEEGCNFQAIGPVLEKDLQFEFALGGGQHVQGKGRITWLDETKKLGGLRFSTLNDEHRQHIRAWLGKTKTADKGEDFALSAAAAPVDSLAKLRRKQLREEARLQWEANQKVGPSAKTVKSQPTLQNREENPRAPATTLQSIDEEALAQQAENRVIVQTSRPSTQMSPERIWSLEPGFLEVREQLQSDRASDQNSGLEQNEEPASRSTDFWKGVAAIVAGAALAAGALVYHRQIGHSMMWLGGIITGDRRETIDPTPTYPGAKGVTSADSAPQIAPSPRTPNEIASNRTSATLPLQLRSTGANGGEAHASPSLGIDSPLFGQDEKNRNNSTITDIQSLWALVESGDIRAEVKLADYYARGEGVIKSCGQARVLLNAAAKRGDLEAKRKLGELEHTGCP